MLKNLWCKIFGSSIDESLVNLELEKDLRNRIAALNWNTNNNETSVLITHYIIKTLREAQTCHRCILRFLDCRDNELYAYSEQELDYAFDHLLGRSTLSKVKVCTACLGALQYADDCDIIIKPILNRLEKEQYETKTFNMTATLPISMSHREKLLKFHISYQLNTGHIKKILSKNNNNNNNKHNDINDVLKAWKQFGIRDPKEPFRFIVTNEIIKLSSSSTSTTTTTTTSDNIISNTTTNNINNLTYDQQAPLHINLIMHHSLTATEHLFLTQVKDPVLLLRKVRKRGVEKTIGDSRQNINEALKALDENEARRITTIPPLPQSEISNIDEINITHDSSYTGGRYIKLSRECSQTPWVIKGKKLADISVSECIVDIFKKYHKCDDTKFVTAGREDANVRMLGTGRPFYCELVNPRRPVLNQEEYHQMELEINSSSKSKDIVQVRQIQNISPGDTKIIKEGEEKKRKTYRALVWLSEPLTQDIIDKCNKAGENEFITYQRTPIRVFQRRGAAVREKTIHSLKMERPGKDSNSHFAIVYMNTQAGTYIKEFVHGDLGRTKPNLATIANVKYADLIELDVMEVDLQWPPLSS